MGENLQDLLTLLILILAFIALFGSMAICVIAMRTRKERGILLKIIIVVLICISLMVLLGLWGALA